MKENIKKYCKKCNKETLHLKTKNQGIGERVVIGIFTFGFNELMVENNYECTTCGTTV